MFATQRISRSLLSQRIATQSTIIYTNRTNIILYKEYPRIIHMEVCIKEIVWNNTNTRDNNNKKNKTQ